MIPKIEDFIQSLRDESLVDFMRASDRQMVEDEIRNYIYMHVTHAVKTISKKIGYDNLINMYPIENIK